MSLANNIQNLRNVISSLEGKASGSGGDSYYDTFWDAYQQNGNRKKYALSFTGEGWTDETFKPKYTPIVPSGFACVETMFHSSAITELKEGIVDFSQATEGYQVFRLCPNLVRVARIDLSKATTSSWFFGGSAKLEEIACVVVNESLTYANFFWGCSALKEVRFEGVIGQAMILQWSPLLTNESVQSIIDHLKDLTGSTAQTLTLHADVGAKLTQTQKDAISAKNWTVTY
jgi:hypothetical protein